MKRVVIIGTSCSGKSDLSRQLSSKLGSQHIKLDELHWGPNWQEKPRDEFARLVGEAISGDRWVVDCNYSEVRHMVWPKATTIIWLDYSFPLVLYRSIRRSIIRAITKEKLFSGNVETLKQSFFSRDSIILWVVNTHHKKRQVYPKVLSSKIAKHAKVKILKSPKQTREFIDAL